MLQVFLAQEVLGSLEGAEREAAPYRDAILEFTDLPLTGVCTVQEASIEIEVYYRDELGTRSSLYRKGSIPTGTEFDAGQDEVLFLYAVALKLVCCHLDELEVLDLSVGLDEKREGIHLVSTEKGVEMRLVSGEQRPDLACTTLYGGVGWARPYMDEVGERTARDLLNPEEKVALAREGDEAMMETVAIAYLEGTDGFDPDPEQAVYWFRQLSNRDNPVAQFNLALHYAKGYGVERDFGKAIEWMDRAAANGDGDAAEVAAKYRAFLVNEDKAKNGDSHAQAEVASFYMALGGSLSHAGSGKDYETALYWAQQSAEAGDGDGIWTLALAYEHGRGVEEDAEQAAALYRRGAELGHAASQHSLACLMMQGVLDGAGEDEAFPWLLASAEQGYGLAMRDLGQSYQMGYGTPEDMTKAIEWYEKSLALIPDPELEDKIAIYKMLEEIELEDEDE